MVELNLPNIVLITLTMNHNHSHDFNNLYLEIHTVMPGPYCGRSPELIPLLRGVLTNPNCEYNANLIPIWTLAHWANCSLDAPTGRKYLLQNSVF